MSWSARLAGVPAWEPGPAGRADVVVAHPDDESLALAAVVGSLCAAGWSVGLTCLTAGEGAFPGLPPEASARLGALRREELAAAWRVLAGEARLTVVGLPDSGLDRATEDVAAAVTEATDGADLLVGLWEHDPHPDHAAVGRALLAAADGRSTVLAPLWARVWFTTAHPLIPWDRLHVVPADAGTRRRRERALAEHRSQLVGFEDRAPVVAPPDRAEFLSDDVVVVTSGGRS